MTELRDRFRDLDRLPAPDLRSEIRQRRPTRAVPGSDRRRVGVAVAAVVLAAAGLALAARAFLGESGDRSSRATGSPASVQERAATVAIAAMTEAGLHHPSDAYDYGGIRGEEHGWVAAFCAPSRVKEECTSESADSFLKVVPDGDELVVAEASGAFTDEQRIAVLGHREAAESPIARWIYGPFELVDSPESEGRALSASFYWTGAIPSNLGAMCRLQVLDDQGQVAYQNRDSFASHPPEVERARDGNFLAEIPDGVQVADGRVVCGEWLPLQAVPDEPRHVLASGTLETGEYRGEEWRLLVWKGENVDDPDVLELWRLNAEGADVYCSAFDVAPLTSWSFGQRVAPGGCSPIQELGKHEAIGSRTSGPVAGEGTHMATGEVSAQVASLELRLTGGEVIEAELLDPPAELGIPRRFFIEFLPPGARGEMAALDDEGKVLATERFGGTGER